MGTVHKNEKKTVAHHKAIKVVTEIQKILKKPDVKKILQDLSKSLTKPQVKKVIKLNPKKIVKSAEKIENSGRDKHLTIVPTKQFTLDDLKKIREAAKKDMHANKLKVQAALKDMHANKSKVHAIREPALKKKHAKESKVHANHVVGLKTSALEKKPLVLNVPAHHVNNHYSRVLTNNAAKQINILLD